jgi:hypothetical protein
LEGRGRKSQPHDGKEPTMTVSISYPEAAEALATALTEGELPDKGVYYLTAAEPEERDGMVVYMVAYMAVDPEESDYDGDPTGFTRDNTGRVQCVGPMF